MLSEGRARPGLELGGAGQTDSAAPLWNSRYILRMAEAGAEPPSTCGSTVSRKALCVEGTPHPSVRPALSPPTAYRTAVPWLVPQPPCKLPLCCPTDREKNPFP